jgi:FMN phosphatase YigB (HAD superfamily)
LLIIFDLDDTLIDTTGTVTPFKLEECLKLLVKKGLRLADFKVAYQELLKDNLTSLKSVDALSKFLLRRNFELSLAAPIFEELTTPLPSHFEVPTTPHAKEILAFFHSLHPLAIVTGGHPPFQLQKLKKAGLDTSIFSKIHIPEDSIKKPYYSALAKEFSMPPEKVWVCGDRIQMDLVPAFELGFRTIHMKWGRGKQLVSEKWIDYSIDTLVELKGIIK